MSGILGIIGGSGVYEIEGLTGVRWEAVASPFGEPSDEMLFGELDGQELVFLPRHGRGHVHSPSSINFRANIDALKRVGVTEILSVSAVGSFKEELAPGTFVVIDQFLDRTRGRARTFFEKGVVAHVSMAHPICGRLADAAYAGAQELGLPSSRGGTYVGMEGPQFSTLAESKLYKSWGADVIGMTNLPEAYLAREAEICYATVAMVTDYDCWHPDHDAVQVADIVAVLLGNADNARSLVKKVAPQVHAFDRPCPSGCHRALEDAIITGPDARDPEVVKRLDAVAGRVLSA